MSLKFCVAPSPLHELKKLLFTPKISRRCQAIFNTSLGHEMCGLSGIDIALQTGLYGCLNFLGLTHKKQL